ncbi:TauD/TfdA dioxygenase family protein [Novosphingobium sp. B 225]|uniref:TauD/TfdA dioxygenase family protein n=1 Tax=Novosphingobium sp. B 225 TaxID=1961849 RepID=UPI001595282D|nr:TauD/TfdA family dioxygenase [Novosphingobium sp. B 225]
MAELLQTRDFRQFRVVPRTPVIGGWIEGCNLAELDEAGLADLREALWQYGVLFGRRQHLSFDAMKRVAYGFGEHLEEHTFAPTKADEGHPEVVVIERLPSTSAKSTTDLWHHDVTSRKHPNIMSLLQAEQVPFGADTMWASMTSAYERMPHALKLLFENVEMEHDSLYLALRHGFGTPEMVARIVQSGEKATHPAVVRHHATGRPCLFVGNAYIKRIKGFETDISEALIKIANDYSKVPELQVRHEWEPGDVALWDNVGTSHYGVSADIGDQLRRLHRVAAWSENMKPEPYVAGPQLSAAA